jgi:tRNA modification GTPase
VVRESSCLDLDFITDFYMASKDTIFALSTAQGHAGIAVIRVSGSESFNVLKSMTRKPLPDVRKASVRLLKDEQGAALDSALVLVFAGPHSFTGEDMVELHVHGGRAVVDGVCAALFAVGLRQAEPGEFTKRAFQNGKMDLTEAEGLADLIDAQTAGQRQQALRQMEGGLRDLYEGWRADILDALAFVEGEIDFPDEEGVPDALAQRAGPILLTLAERLKATILNSERGERVRHGVEIAIIGAPNAGKSSILNALTGRDIAIVSEQAGTTRDIIEAHIELAGLPVRLSDTAGLRESDDVVEKEGVRRALVRAAEADLRICVIDSADEIRADIAQELKPDDIILYNKADIYELPLDNAENVSRETFLISAKTGRGFNAFLERLEIIVSDRFTVLESVGLTRARHKACVQKALIAIETAQLNLSIAPELAGSDLRDALRQIQELAGETDIEAVLDRVFSSFCIGK